MKGWVLMKKIVLVSASLFLFSINSMTLTSASEIYPSDNNESIVGPKATYIKIWFKGIPPEKYKGKTRVNYYKNQGGYTGVYV